MEIVAMQLTQSARSVLNMSFVTAEDPRSPYSMKHTSIDGTPGVLLTHETKGTYWLPMSSIAWCRVQEKPQAKRGRPKKQMSDDKAA